MELGNKQRQNENTNKINDILIKNDYPKQLIKQLIDKRINTTHANNETPEAETHTKTQYISITYVPCLTEKHNLDSVFEKRVQK